MGAITAGACTVRDLADGVTSEGVLSLTPGMNFDELVATIGLPVCYSVLNGPRDSPTRTCADSGTIQVPDAVRQAGRISLHYARDYIPLSTSYPIVRIQLRHGKVTAVAVHEGGIADTRLIYWHDADRKWGDVEEVRALIGR